MNQTKIDALKKALDVTTQAYYMNTRTGTVDTQEGWVYTDGNGVSRCPVSEGQVVKVLLDENGEWAEA